MSREVNVYQTPKVQSEAPTSDQQPAPQPQALVAGGSVVKEMAAHEKPVKAQPKASLSEELKVRLAKGEKPSEEMLDAAIARGSRSAVRLLVKSGLDLDRQGPDGNTRLHDACKAGEAKTVKFLLDCGADLHVDNKDYMPPAVMAFNLPPTTRNGVLSELANHKDGAVQVASWARHMNRDDILNWVVTNGHIDPRLL